MLYVGMLDEIGEVFIGGEVEVDCGVIDYGVYGVGEGLLFG